MCISNIWHASSPLPSTHTHHGKKLMQTNKITERNKGKRSKKTRRETFYRPLRGASHEKNVCVLQGMWVVCTTAQTILWSRIACAWRTAWSLHMASTKRWRFTYVSKFPVFSWLRVLWRLGPFGWAFLQRNWCTMNNSWLENCLWVQIWLML